MKLQAFFTELDKFSGRIPLDELSRLVSDVEITMQQVAESLNFKEEHYCRNLIYEAPSCQVLVLCWFNGQRSQIHDHKGSSCALKILEGEAIETQFEVAPNGMIYAAGSKKLNAGEVCANQDDDIHQVSNLQADDACLVTLHVYSPPLKDMSVYNLTESQARKIAEPVAALLNPEGQE